MNRTALAAIAILTATAGAIFAVYPELDLHLTSPFFDAHTEDFWSRHVSWMGGWRNLTTAILAVLALAPLIGLALKVMAPREAGRALLFLWSTLLLGPGLLVNGLLKQFGGRPRPIDVFGFGGSDYFVAWWDLGGDCLANCSFVSGEVSAAAWTLAPAALAPARWRPLAYGASLAFTAFVGLQRLAAGAHFFTDIVFAGTFTFLIVWIMHRLIYRHDDRASPAR